MEQLNFRTKTIGKSLLILLSLAYGCTQKNEQNGQHLAKQYCGSCHLFPEPSLLSKNIWIQKVLPNMATRMGIPRGYPYDKLQSDDVQAVMKAHVIPENPMLSEQDMLKIVEYYAQNAPEKAILQKRSIEPQTDLSLFSTKTLASQPISTLNILLKQLGSQPKIILGFEDKGTHIYDFKTKQYQRLKAAISTDAVVWNNHLFAFDLTGIEAHNLPRDFIWKFSMQNNQVIDKPSKILDGLIRPVSMDIADLNNDNKPDFVVCEFGDYLGQLSLHLSSANGYIKSSLKNTPGACKVYFRDMNNDTKLDIVAMMAQGREEICLFINNNNAFEEKIIARFPSCYGSNVMQLVDFNKDGLTDIVMTNGDNADMSSSLKAYHGVRLLTNKGNQQFKEEWFYPINGASEVAVDDFDKDGDEDLVVIAHFPDFAKANAENLIYFRNDGGLKLIPMTFKKALNGRLLTLAKMDIDSDGDTDLLIGNHVDFLTEPNKQTLKNWDTKKHDWWILENKTIDK